MEGSRKYLRPRWRPSGVLWWVCSRRGGRRSFSSGFRVINMKILLLMEVRSLTSTSQLISRAEVKNVWVYRYQSRQDSNVWSLLQVWSRSWYSRFHWSRNGFALGRWVRRDLALVLFHRELTRANFNAAQLRFKTCTRNLRTNPPLHLFNGSIR